MLCSRPELPRVPPSLLSDIIYYIHKTLCGAINCFYFVSSVHCHYELQSSASQHDILQNK